MQVKYGINVVNQEDEIQKLFDPEAVVRLQE